MGKLLTIQACSRRSNNRFYVAFDGSLGENSGSAELTISFVYFKRQQYNVNTLAMTVHFCN